MTTILWLILYLIINLTGSQNVTIGNVHVEIFSTNEIDCIFTASVSINNESVNGLFYNLHSYEDCSFNVAEGFEG